MNTPIQAEQISKDSFLLSVGYLEMVCAGQWIELAPCERKTLVAILLSAYAEISEAPEKVGQNV